jgi:hypothetical protein
MDASPYHNKKKLKRLCDVRIETLIDQNDMRSS